MSRSHWSRVIAAMGAFVISSALMPAGLSGASPTNPRGGPDCTPVLELPLGGEQAIEALGVNIERGAARSAMTVAEFARALRTDSTLRVDVCGYPFYVEPVAPPKATAVHQADGNADEVHGSPGLAPNAEEALDASGNVFTLASRPGSLRTIYLNFKGATVSGTAWNSYFGLDPIVAPAFSFDADSATFTVAEQDVIREVWLRVAEDYAPFDVNVTTADPGFAAISRSSEADNTFGAVVLITNDSVVQGQCRCGGLAYPGVFDLSVYNTFYQPAWVFQRGTGGYAKFMSEAASHEVGHNLGLSHDGTVPNPGGGVSYYAGHGAWAPIMGLAYSRPVTQWSMGEYAYANNSENDLEIINSRGAPIAPDDHGDSAAAATALGAGSASSGVIGTATDSDWFGFSASGDITITAIPQAVGADLDIGLQLYDSAGELVASADPPVAMVSDTKATGLAATLNVTLNAGTYYVKIDGLGFGDGATGYTDYGSLGRYDISLQRAPLVISTTSLTDGTALTSYSATMVATGGIPPYGWELAAGALPAGLSLSAAGVISGTPTAPTTASFTVKVTDAAGASASNVMSLVIAPAPLQITTTGLPQGRLNRVYSATLAASGGALPYTWARFSGMLPRGLTLSKAGVIYGRPTSSGTYTITVKVTDSRDVAATKSLSLKITR